MSQANVIGASFALIATNIHNRYSTHTMKSHLGHRFIHFITPYKAPLQSFYNNFSSGSATIAACVTEPRSKVIWKALSSLLYFPTHLTTTQAQDQHLSFERHGSMCQALLLPRTSTRDTGDEIQLQHPSLLGSLQRVIQAKQARQCLQGCHRGHKSVYVSIRPSAHRSASSPGSCPNVPERHTDGSQVLEPCVGGSDSEQRPKARRLVDLVPPESERPFLHVRYLEDIEALANEIKGLEDWLKAWRGIEKVISMDDVTKEDER